MHVAVVAAGQNGAVTVDRPDRAERSRPRARMTGPERREQLLAVGRKLFADKGFEATTVEEVASKASVSKPVVYEHFGGKEGIYAVVVDREMQRLMDQIVDALDGGSHPRELLEQAACALLGYIEGSTDGFRIRTGSLRFDRKPSHRSPVGLPAGPA